MHGSQPNSREFEICRRWEFCNLIIATSVKILHASLLAKFVKLKLPSLITSYLQDRSFFQVRYQLLFSKQNYSTSLKLLADFINDIPLLNSNLVKLALYRILLVPEKLFHHPKSPSTILLDKYFKISNQLKKLVQNISEK